MYNTHFQVKYDTIRRELEAKLYSEPTQEYTREDIGYMCEKLYHDELVSVFGATDVLDDEIDREIARIKSIMMGNVAFRSLLEGCTDTLMEQYECPPIDREYMVDNVFLLLFNQHMFHCMHPCICQQLTTGNVDEATLLVLKEQLMKQPNE